MNLTDYISYNFFGHKATFFYSREPAVAHSAGFLFCLERSLPYIPLVKDNGKYEY